MNRILNTKPLRFIKKYSYNKITLLVLVISLLVGAYYIYKYHKINSEYKKIQNISNQLSAQLSEAQTGKVSLEDILNKVNVEFEELKNQDQVKINKELQEEINNIQKTYSSSVTSYEDLLKLKESVKDTKKLDDLYTDALVFLSKRNYASASAALSSLSQKIKDEQNKLTASITVPANIPENNIPPGSGYSRQKVTTGAGGFMVSIVAADMSSTKVIVDTSFDSDCSNNCPTTTLANFISRNGAYAGITGAYYCPASYPSCAGKTNTFDLLIMNKNKHYFNSDNNVYSTNPAVIFGNGWIRFVSEALQWGRDTGVDGVLSNFPLLVFNNESRFSGNSDSKMISKSTRGFVSNKGNAVFIGYVHNATVAESAGVLKAMGMENAINLDGGGSVSLWASGGYKVGPGRELTNAILFLKK